jgi:hypothetical protein
MSYQDVAWMRVTMDQSADKDLEAKHLDHALDNIPDR